MLIYNFTTMQGSPQRGGENTSPSAIIFKQWAIDFRLKNLKSFYCTFYLFYCLKKETIIVLNFHLEQKLFNCIEYFIYN